MVNYMLVTYPRRSSTSLLDGVADHNHEGLHMLRICSAKCVTHSADAVLFSDLLLTYSNSLHSCTDAVSVFSHHSSQVLVYLLNLDI